MARSSRTHKRRNGDYISQRAAEYLHGGVDRMAAQGERLERRLQDGYEYIDTEAHRLHANVRGTLGEHPWMAIGSSAALGFLVGLLSSRRM